MAVCCNAQAIPIDQDTEEMLRSIDFANVTGAHIPPVCNALFASFFALRVASLNPIGCVSVHSRTSTATATTAAIAPVLTTALVATVVASTAATSPVAP